MTVSDVSSHAARPHYTASSTTTALTLSSPLLSFTLHCLYCCCRSSVLCVVSVPVVVPPPRGFKLGEVHIDPFRSFKAEFTARRHSPHTLAPPYCTALTTPTYTTQRCLHHTTVSPCIERPFLRLPSHSLPFCSLCVISVSSNSARHQDKFFFSPPVGQPTQLSSAQPAVTPLYFHSDH